MINNKADKYWVIPHYVLFNQKIQMSKRSITISCCVSSSLIMLLTSTIITLNTESSILYEFNINNNKIFNDLIKKFILFKYEKYHNMVYDYYKIFNISDNNTCTLQLFINKLENKYKNKLPHYIIDYLNSLLMLIEDENIDEQLSKKSKDF
jgi:hypothetical protein